MTRRPAVIAECDGRHLVAGAVHTHTTMSDGRRRPHELAEHAHARGLGVVCVTDHHFDSWRYPLGIGRLSVGVRRSSVVRHGFDAYLSDIAELAAAGLGPLVLPGIEVMPHYRWEGWPPFLRCQAMKTGVVYGITDPAVLAAMPMQLDGSGASEAQARVVAQALIDYLHAHGGLFFWSHLELDEQIRFLSAAIRYQPRPELLADSWHYSGFGCFPQGHERGCRPGGAWDQRLALNLAQGRGDGPWVLGECDYHWGDSAQPYENIANPTTVFELDTLSPDAVLQALRGGRMYAYQGPDFRSARLDRFELANAGGTARAGQLLRGDDAPQLTLSLSGFDDGCRILVIAAGQVVAEHRRQVVAQSLPRPQGAGYACRVMIDSPRGDRVMSNPIFVVPQRAAPSR